MEYNAKTQLVVKKIRLGNMLCFFLVSGSSGKPQSYPNDLLVHIYDLDIISCLLPTG